MKHTLPALVIFAAVFLLELASGISGFGIPPLYADHLLVPDDPFAAAESADAFFAAGEFDPIFKLRFFRAAAAMTVGGSLALAGLLLQAVLKNPLAEPFVLGISGGAAAGAGITIFTGAAAASAFASGAGAFAGALIVLGAVLAMAGRGRSGERLLLSGVMAGAMAGALLTVMTALCRDTGKIAAMTRWMLGDLQSPPPELLLPAAAAALAALAASMYGAKALNVISMDDEAAFHLGYDPVKTGRFFVCTAALLTAMTVAVAGIIGFCGLVVPHTVKRIAGYDHRKNILPVFLWGGIFLGVCDALGSGIIFGMTLPAGAVTTIAGAPVFLWILNKRRCR